MQSRLALQLSAAAVLALPMMLLLAPGDELAAQPAPGPADETAADEALDTPVDEALDELEDPDAAEEAKTSRHGTYEWKFAWGAGIEYGFFVTDLDRWNLHLLAPNGAQEIDDNFMGVHDLAVEVYPIEGLRIAAFGGVASLYSDDPSLLAWYVGLEPAFSVRRDIFELSAGIGVGGGQMELETSEGAEATATAVLVRPFIEPRIYPTEWMAIYLRLAFNLFSVTDFESDSLALPTISGETISADNLSEAGLYASLGFRFGSYPAHVAEVLDSDGDTYRDDVDACPEQAEDFDGFQDDDGCPDLDNDNDGIPDAQDACPDTAEDLDGWMDEDGCPEADDDTDGDGILNPVDQCPEQPEDFDNFQDEDGCPDLDNDGDGIPDAQDKCPDEAGVPQKQGCPFRRVEVTLEAIVINEKIFFELDKAVIKPESYDLLNELAQVIKDNPQIKLIEIGGHTDTAGKDKYNLQLSQERAEAVRDYLAAQGVEAERLTAKGFGETQPLVPTPEGEKESEEAAAANRRVEFRILEQEEVKQIMREDQVPNDAGDVTPVEPTP